MTLLAHFPAYRVLTASALALSIAPAALAQSANPAAATAQATPTATLPPENAPAPTARAPVAPSAPAPAPAPTAANENPDAYLDADFPNAARLEVAPPVASASRSERAAPDGQRSRIVYTDTGYEEPRERKPQGPKATERGPFLVGVADLLIAADYYTIVGGGIGAGTFLGKRFRVAGTLSAPLDFTASTRGDVDSPEAVFGANAGVALVRRNVFALSLAADVTTTNSSDLGWNVGIAMPLDWVTRSGFRIGIMPSIFQNFGTSGNLDCDDYDYDYETGRSYCSGGGTARPETGVHLQANIGFTLK